MQMISRVAYTIRNTFIQRGAFVSSKGGGTCAMAQWHNGQSKTVDNHKMTGLCVVIYPQ